MNSTFIEVHGEQDGKRGALTFEVLGNKEEFEEIMRAGDWAIKQLASLDGRTPNDFAMRVLRQLPQAANREDDPDKRRLMCLASLCIVLNWPTRLPNRAIRNCSLKLRNDGVDVHIIYLD